MKWFFIICISFFKVNGAAGDTPPSKKPYFSVILADWGTNKVVHNDIEKKCPSHFTLALHILGKGTSENSKNPLLIQVPTLQQLHHASTYQEKLAKKYD